jgi:hypothetical protein
MPVIPAMQAAEMQRIRVQASLGKKHDPICRAKMAGGVTQVLQLLPCKCEALSSNPRTAIKRPSQ